MNDPAVHLYLHAPFCRSRCPYCDVPVTTGPVETERWLRAIAREWTLREGSRALADAGVPGPRTLHIGGGTPSLLSAEGVEGVARWLAEAGQAGPEEWGIEANPEDLTPELLRRWRAAGVTRVVSGVQSLEPEVLELLGRRHTADEATRSLEVLRRSDLPSWGADLLWGLPQSAERSLDELIDRQVPHISILEFVAEPGTPLGDEARAGRLALPSDDEKGAEYLRLAELLSEAGYRAYEMNSWALEGHASHHWEGVWRGEPYLGLGPGAHSFLDGARSWNLGDWSEYQEWLEGDRVPQAGFERPSPRERRLERIWSGLRSAHGIARAGFSSAAGGLLTGWEAEGWIHPDPDRVRLTPEGWLRLDGLVLELAEVAGTRED